MSERKIEGHDERTRFLSDWSANDFATWCSKTDHKIPNVLPDLYPDKSGSEMENFKEADILNCLTSNTRILEKIAKSIYNQLSELTEKIQIDVWTPEIPGTQQQKKSFHLMSDTMMSEVSELAVLHFKLQNNIDSLAITHKNSVAHLRNNDTLAAVVKNGTDFVLISLVHVEVSYTKQSSVPEQKKNFDVNTRMSVDELTNMAVAHFRHVQVLNPSIWKFAIVHKATPTDALDPTALLASIITTGKQFGLKQMDPVVKPRLNWTPPENEKHLDLTAKFNFSVTQATTASRDGKIVTPEGKIYVKSKNARAPYYHEIEVQVFVASPASQETIGEPPYGTPVSSSSKKSDSKYA